MVLEEEALAGRRAHSPVDEPLEAPAVEVLADIDVAFAVDRKREAGLLG
jgi:hypothetical protein